MGRSERVTGPLNPVVHRVGARFRLVVVADNAIQAIHVLPESGDVTIGRSDDNTIQIDDESISRRHAVLHVGTEMTIEDLGSSNGTKVRDVVLSARKPHAVAVNELMTLGSLTVVIQGRFTSPQINRIATHEYFQTRVEEECARAERNNTQFAVIAVNVTPAGAPEPVIVEALTATLRQSDVLGKLGEHEYGLLLVDSTRSQAELVARRLIACLEELKALGTYMVVHFPSDGRNAFELMTRISGHSDDPDRDDLVIAEQSMRNLYALVQRIAPSELPVLILGETGVGKEKMSRAVHQASPRANKPFIAINCAALNDALLESELFGHERGAFTGANTVKTGLLEAASGGTVFLDEIGDMSLSIQAKLLRVIEDGEVRRVGGLKSRKIGVRFIAATNTDPEAATERGRFREDLYFRLSAATLVIPPLRERPREIELLARRFASDAAARTSGTPKQITADALALLKHYSWPGNIRELRNVIERAVMMCGTEPIGRDHLPVEKMRGTFVRAVTNTSTPDVSPAPSGDERARILHALEQAGGNQAKAAGLLGVSRRTLINRLEQYNLPRPRKGRLRE